MDKKALVITLRRLIDNLSETLTELEADRMSIDTAVDHAKVDMVYSLDMIRWIELEYTEVEEDKVVVI